MRSSTISTIVAALSVLLSGSLRAQQEGEQHVTVTYRTSTQVYFDAGSDDGIAQGDTLVLIRGETKLAETIIIAVASHSSVGRLAEADSTIRIGDSAVSRRLGGTRALKVPAADPGTRESRPGGPVGTGTRSPHGGENVVSGRFAVQFSGEWTDDTRLNVGQPSAAGRMRIENLEGTGIALSFSGREYYDLTNNYLRYGDSIRSRFDLYEFQIELDRPGDNYGFSLGRRLSHFVPALGTIDGAQAFVRAGGITSGIVLGRGIGGRATGLGGSQTKSALFVGYRQADDGPVTFEGSIAYARESVGSNLDRSFLSMQSSAAAGMQFAVYGNADVELSTIDNGRRTSAFSFSNASLVTSYHPDRWISATLGYDATRNVYLFESMKLLPDSLFREPLMHGIRASVMTRFTPGISLSITGGLRKRAGDPRTSSNLGGYLRLGDILGSKLNGGVRYGGFTGTSIEGRTTSLEVDKELFRTFDVQLRYSNYAYSVVPNKQSYLTQIASLVLSSTFTRTLFGSVGGDYVMDKTINSIRVFLEAGTRF